ncbi:hypothetical protein BK131_09900 [Paenibacillus amylolyticus]|uniref:Cbb3-type cytochrome c oxidase subunit I n=1 Tax=Paenibacillus amylolyticus TaxID=1451 RepID=A0A1R1BZM1_PAEAM|nr:hypothetical protein [Paenibacillus amylolyticus]OMF15198.1 hypothetical protein BK131_09900 [Paenibacillus amylolyticus]
MSRLPFLFIITGIFGFVMYHAFSLLSLTGWLGDELRGPEGWFHAHLFVLGWATMLAMGAIYQLIHVILQSNIYSLILGYCHYFLFSIGIAGMLYGFIRADVIWIAGSATLALSGILLFVWNMGATLLRASQWNPVTISAACSCLYLVLTGLSGMLMGLNFAFGDWNGLHERLFGAHIWMGTLGWFGMLITGFSYKMLPMFYLSHDYSIRLQKVVLVLWNAAVVTGVFAFLTGIKGGLLWLALLLLTAALLFYVYHLEQIQEKRHKSNPGPGIRWSVYVSRAFAVYAVALLIYSSQGTELLLHPRVVLLSGWVYLGGWLSLTILGYASKIVPFLWWTHKYGKQAGRPGTPLMAGMLSERHVNWGMLAMVAGSLLLVSGILINLAEVMMVGGTILSLVSIVYITNIALVFRR